MNAKAARALIGVALVAVAIVLLIVLQNGGGEGSDSAVGTVPTIVVENGKPVGGVRTLEYRKGDRIRFKVRSDVAGEVHVHGYDLHQDVEAGGTVQFDFPATIEGVFEAELEERKEQIAELRVNP